MDTTYNVFKFKHQPTIGITDVMATKRGRAYFADDTEPVLIAHSLTKDEADTLAHSIYMRLNKKN